MVGNGDGGNSASRFSSSSYFDLARGETKPPAIVVDHDGDMVRVVEGSRAAFEGGVIEIPLRRGEPPISLKIRAGIFRSPAGRVRSRSNTGTTSSCRWRQRLLVGLAADQIAADRDQRLDARGQIAATMPAVRAPQSKPATTALSIFSASIRAMTSVASAPCWPLRVSAVGASCRSRAARARSPGSLPTPAPGRHRRRRRCRRASRAGG